QVRRALAGLILERGISSPRKQRGGDLRAAAFRRYHESGAAAGIAVIDMGASVQQIFDDLDCVSFADLFIGPRSPHQQGEIMWVARIDIDIPCQQAPYDVQPS